MLGKRAGAGAGRIEGWKLGSHLVLRQELELGRDGAGLGRRRTGRGREARVVVVVVVMVKGVQMIVKPYFLRRLALFQKC
jgi:hypothetical protein